MKRFLLSLVALTVGVATLPGSVQAMSTTCITSTVCAEYINTFSGTSGGVAIHGEANGGIGVRGTSVTNTGFYGASGSGSAGAPGVEGESTNNTGMDAGAGFGLLALSASVPAPFYGALGVGSGSGLAGVTTNAGTSAKIFGAGVVGDDNLSRASGSADYNAGTAGVSQYGTGVLAEANGSPTSGVYATAPIGVYAVAKVQSGTPVPASYAFVGESDYTGLELRNTANGASTFVQTPLFFLVGNGPTNGGGSYYYITYTGNEYLSGTLTTSHGGPYVRTTGSSGAAVREYTTRSTVPNVEDFGEAQLANGRAFVPIDGHFGDTIDRRSSYLVFVTPEGDCKGLYVTQKTPSGFAVRELQGGRSSLAFQYRIVAKPIDENGTRLEAMPADPLPKDVALESKRRTEHVDAILSPEQRLKERLGPKGYADLMKALLARASMK